MKEKDDNKDTEQIIKSLLDEIRRMVKDGKREMLWLEKETAWADFPSDFRAIFSVLPLPSEEPSAWGVPYQNIYQAMMKAIGAKDWIPNMYAGYGSWQFWHEYAATNIPNVFVHSFSWGGEAWGGSRLLISVNIEEKEFSSLGNISKEIYESKYQEILDAIASGKPQTILLKEKRDRVWYGTEIIPSEISDRIFQKIPKWFSTALPNETNLDEKVYEQFARKIRTQVLSFIPIVKKEQIKTQKGGSFDWLYDITKFSNAYFHMVIWEHEFRGESSIVGWWEFLTIGIPEEDFKSLKQ